MISHDFYVIYLVINIIIRRRGMFSLQHVQLHSTELYMLHENKQPLLISSKPPPQTATTNMEDREPLSSGSVQGASANDPAFGWHGHRPETRTMNSKEKSNLVFQRPSAIPYLSWPIGPACCQRSS